ncbi:RNA polymerase sigma factor [Sphaerisporangium siamense]|uniref:RNA polymerase sigma-70 factor (ECF subfamily) n=1 Tax=Sphaerisporangium siamense TaxID=795645 RepID=A0A7W7GA93_9ACTN|nr:sigma-70 family RNA polymerase sigma factor [Sphaerisporangium siamense]MBB4703703.1 RNA polymerase sigma-70 factor (ECF subfamily) [Sphaerisporangium siamense]GII82175.1 RNA polymerase sigma factor [Sphaerisporangium siamense]
MQAKSPEQASALEQAASAFVELRPRLFGIAYRMLGSAAEAEDVLQEVWVRWQGTDREAIGNPAAFLALITTRLSINVAQSARARRETYIGPWLPEPVDTSLDPTLGAERGEALELAFLLLLERLTPTERAAYVLREAFVYPYAQIADILRLSPVNARQLVSRARKRLAAGRHEPIDETEHRRLLGAFLAAARTGNVAALEDLFAADVVSSSDGGGVRGAARFPLLAVLAGDAVVVSDGGGKVRAAVRPTCGADAVARFVTAFLTGRPGIEIVPGSVNGRTGLVLCQASRAVAVVGVSVAGAKVTALWITLNPDKLRRWHRP